MDVSNDTQLVDGEFRPFVPHASHEQARERQAAAHDAEWAAAAAAAAAGGAGRLGGVARAVVGQRRWLRCACLPALQAAPPISFLLPG